MTYNPFVWSTGFFGTTSSPFENFHGVFGSRSGYDFVWFAGQLITLASIGSNLPHNAGYLMKMAVSDTLTFGAETCTSYTPNYGTTGPDLNGASLQSYTSITSSFVFT
jgi:hypothetical protein